MIHLLNSPAPRPPRFDPALLFAINSYIRLHPLPAESSSRRPVYPVIPVPLLTDLLRCLQGYQPPPAVFFFLFLLYVITWWESRTNSAMISPGPVVDIWMFLNSTIIVLSYVLFRSHKYGYSLKHGLSLMSPVLLVNSTQLCFSYHTLQ